MDPMGTYHVFLVPQVRETSTKNHLMAIVKNQINVKTLGNMGIEPWTMVKDGDLTAEQRRDFSPRAMGISGWSMLIYDSATLDEVEMSRFFGLKDWMSVRYI